MSLSNSYYYSEMIEKFESKIKVAGRAVEYWGSQSISSDASALFELIKNSRDADATKVEVIFENVASDGGIITIKDNGNGMTKKEVDESYVIYDTNTLESLTDIPQLKIIAIEPTIQGTSITIITENNKKFSFE